MTFYGVFLLNEKPMLGMLIVPLIGRLGPFWRNITNNGFLFEIPPHTTVCYHVVCVTLDGVWIDEYIY
jgi:hypothetical protein